MFDWQSIVVALVVVGALLYVARRGLARLRSFRAPRGGAASCATGCGNCGDEPAPARPANVLVQISPARTNPRRN